MKDSPGVDGLSGVCRPSFLDDLYYAPTHGFTVAANNSYPVHAQEAFLFQARKRFRRGGARTKRHFWHRPLLGGIDFGINVSPGAPEPPLGKIADDESRRCCRQGLVMPFSKVSPEADQLTQLSPSMRFL